MFKKMLIAGLAATAGLTALPAAAEAGPYRDGYYGRGGYERGYDRGYDGRGYDRGYYGRGYDRGYYRQGYRGSRYGYGYGYRDNRRCGSGTTGAVIGGAAGTLIGRDIARDGRRGRYARRGGDGTAGAIIGGAVGALIGREIDRSC